MTYEPENPVEKAARYQAALDAFVARLAEDRYVLAAVQVGSFAETIIWRKESICLWIIEADGVARRMRYDGEDVRMFRTFIEDSIEIHAEVIPRTRFKRMVEGASRTAFTHSFFALRKLVHSQDGSIAQWFDEANSLATRDREKELLAVATCVIHAHRDATKYLHDRGDLELTRQHLLWAAWCLAAIRIIDDGEVYEDEFIYRAMEREPDLFRIVYEDIVATPADRARAEAALVRIDEYLAENSDRLLKPLLDYLRKQRRVVPLSELADHFAHTQLYPWHLYSACDWLDRKARLQKLSAPFKLTKRSRTELEEPAYFWDD